MLWLILACTGGDGDSAEAEAPTLTWIQPTDGADTAVGDLDCSVVVDDFELVESSTAKHNEGDLPQGYLSVRLDGTEVLTTNLTQFTVTVDAGEHTLEGELFYEDGDELEPPVTASVGFVAVE